MDQGFFNIPVHLNYSDEYLLITGTADAGDGLGSSPFSAAFSPVSEVPEPSTITMMIIGTILLVSSVPGLWSREMGNTPTCKATNGEVSHSCHLPSKSGLLQHKLRRVLR